LNQFVAKIKLQPTCFDYFCIKINNSKQKQKNCCYNNMPDGKFPERLFAFQNGFKQAGIKFKVRYFSPEQQESSGYSPREQTAQFLKLLGS